MESGTRARDVSADPRNSDDGELAGYHSLCVAAVASLLLGLASPIVVLGPMLLVVPLAGIAAALAALRQIADSDGALVGRRAALVGLVLSVACGFAVTSHALVTRQLRIAQADEFGRKWIATLLAGDTQQAYRIGTGLELPKPPPPEESPPPGPDPYEELLQRPAVQSLLAAGANSNIRYDGVNDYERGWGGQFRVRLRYVVTPHPLAAAAGGPPREPIAILLAMQRKRLPGESLAAWTVANSELAGKTADAGRAH